MKDTPQARYKRKNVVTRRVDFYPTDSDILTFTHEINFAAFVKEKLREEMKQNGKTDIPNS